VAVTFTVTELTDQLHHNNVPAHCCDDQAKTSASSQQCACTFYISLLAFLAKHHITQVCQPPYSQDLAPCAYWILPKPKSPFEPEDICL